MTEDAAEPEAEEVFVLVDQSKRISSNGLKTIFPIEKN